MAGILDVANAIRMIGVAAQLSARDAQEAAQSMRETRSGVTGGSSNTGGLGASTGGAGSSGGSMTGGSPIATAISAEIRRIVR